MYAVAQGIRVLVDNGTRRKHLEWVRAVLAHSGMNQTALARKAGVDPSTLSRFLREVNPGAKLDSETIERIARLNIIPPFDTTPPEKPRGFNEDEAAPYDAKFDDAAGRAIAAARSGRNGIDPWVLKSRALELAGYMPGDVLMVDLNAEAAAGDTVCAQVYDQAGRAETVMRIFEDPYLVAATTDPLLRKPLQIGKDPVIIRGVVIATIRPRRAA